MKVQQFTEYSYKQNVFPQKKSLNPFGHTYLISAPQLSVISKVAKRCKGARAFFKCAIPISKSAKEVLGLGIRWFPIVYPPEHKKEHFLLRYRKCHHSDLNILHIFYSRDYSVNNGYYGQLPRSTSRFSPVIIYLLVKFVSFIVVPFPEFNTYFQVNSGLV